MRVRHPTALADVGHVDDAVDVAGDTRPIDDDGTFEIDDDEQAWLDAWADGYGYDAAELVVTETCQTVKADGAVCGRELPCPYHSEED